MLANLEKTDDANTILGSELTVESSIQDLLATKEGVDESFSTATTCEAGWVAPTRVPEFKVEVLSHRKLKAVIVVGSILEID